MHFNQLCMQFGTDTSQIVKKGYNARMRGKNKRCSQVHVKREVKVMGESNILGRRQSGIRILMEVVLLLELAAAVEVLVLVVQIRADERTNIPCLSAFDLSHALPQSVCAKDDAPANISFMLVTLDTSHFEMPRLNDDAE